MSRFKQDVDKSEGIVDELREKASKFSQAANFAGFKRIHKTAFKQLSTGKFGISKEEADSDMMKSMGFDMEGMDLSGDFDFDAANGAGGDSSSSAESSTSPDGSVTEITNKNYYTNINKGSSDNGEVVSAIASGAITGLGGLAAIGGILSEINKNIGLLDAFQKEKTSMYYDLSLEASKALVAAQEKQSADSAKMYQYFADLQDQKTLKAAQEQTGIDMGSMLDPSRLLGKINDSFFTSDMVLGGLGNEIGKIAKDPIGFLASAALFGSAFGGGRGLVGEMFGSQIDKVERMAKNLPYLAQNKLESWSAGRDYGKSGFSIENILASIGDNLKLDIANPKLKLNQDADGATSFDTVTRRSIITEIPGYLSKILMTLQQLTDITSRAHNLQPDSKIGHTVYDRETGKFEGEHKYKSAIASRFRKINRGETSEGFGTNLKQAMTASGVKGHDARRLQASLLGLANSNFAGMTDLKDSKSVKEMLGRMWDQEIKKRKGQTNEEYEDFKKRTIAKRISKISPHLDSVIGTMNASGKSDDILAADLATRKAALDKIRVEKGEAQYKAEHAKFLEYKKRVEKLKASGDLGTHYSNNLEDSFIRHGADTYQAVVDEGKRMSGKTSGMVAALNGDITEVKGKKDYTVKNKDADKLRKMAEQFRDRAKASRAASGSDSGFFDSIVDKIGGVGTKVYEKIGKAGDSIAKSVKSGITSVFGLDKKETKGKSLLETMSFAFDQKALLPFKRMLIGKSEGDATKMSFLDTVKLRWDTSILTPMKKAMLGEGATAEEAQKTSFFESLNKGMNRTVLMPLKTWLIGDEKAAKRVGFFKAIEISWNKNVMLPVKTWMMGGDKKSARKMTFLQVVGDKLEKSVFLPLRTSLLGGNEKKAKNLSMWGAISHSFDRNITHPLKKLMLPDADVRTLRKTSFLTAMRTSFDQKVLQPIKGWLFGEEGKKKSFFKNFSEWMGPRINKILFGDKAKDNTLWGNIKNTLKGVGTFISDKVFKPLKGWFLDELMPSMKDMFKEVGAEVKRFFGKAKDFFTKDLVKGAKGIMKEILGDDMIKTIREKVVDPFKNAIAKLGETLGGFFKFFLRLPVNLFKGIADSIKLNRMKRGEGNFSDDERNRLEALDKKGSTFDFMAGVRKKAEDTKKAVDDALTPPADVGQRFKKAGEQVSEGFEEGIVDGTKTIWEKVKDMGTGVLDKVKAVFDIHSPSRKMRELGEHVVEGFIEGLKRKEQEALAIIDRLSNSLQNRKLELSGEITAKVDEGAEKGGRFGEIIKQLHANVTETKKTTSILDKIHDFMKGNLSEVDKTTKKILYAMKNGGKGAGEIDLYSSPLSWMGNKLDSLLSTGLKTIKGFVDGAANVLKSFSDLPKKVLGMFGDLAKSAMSVVTNLLPNIGDLAASAMKTLSNLAKNAGDTFVNMTDKVLQAGLKLAGQIGNAIKPLTDAFVDVTSTLISGLKPAVTSLTTALTSAVQGLATFAGKLLDFAGQLGNKVLDFSAKHLGISIGKGRTGGGLMDPNAIVKVSLVNSFVGGSAANPMYVHVVDGKVQVYRKEKPSVKMTDNIEDVTAAADKLKGKKDAEKKEDKKDDTLDKLKDVAGTVAGAAAPGLIGKAATTVGAKVAAAKAGASSILGKIVDRGDYTKAKAIDKFRTADKINVRSDEWKNLSKADRSKILSERKAAAKAGETLKSSRTVRINEGLKKAGGKVTGAIDKVGKGASWIGDKISGAGKAVTKATTGKFGTGGAGNLISKATSGAVDKIGGLAKTSIEKVGSSRIGQAVGGALEKVPGGAIAKTVGGAAGKLGGAAASMTGKAFGGVVGTGVKAIGSTVANVGVRMPTAIAGGAMNMAGKAVSGVAGMAGKMAGSVMKIGAKGLTIGGVVGGLGEVISDTIFEKGGHAHKIFTNSFKTLGGASTGAMIGSMILPGVGTLIGGVIGAAASGLTDALAGVKDWLEDTFKDEIQNATGFFLEFPEKLSGWIEKLPEKVDKFAEEIPNKIMAFFSTPTTSELDPTTGLPKEEKPSILWKMVKALGNAGMSLVAQAPKLAITLGESLTKVLVAGIITAGGFMLKGFARFGNMIQNAFEDNVYLPLKGSVQKQLIKLGDFVSGVFEDGFGGSINRVRQSLADMKISIFGKEFAPFSFLAVSDQEKADMAAKAKAREESTNQKLKAVDTEQDQYKLARDKRQQASLQAIDDGTKGAIATSNKLVGGLGDALRSATGANAAAEWGKGLGKGDRNQNRYAQAMEAAKGDEKKAKEEYAKKFLISEEEAATAKAKNDGSYERLVAERTASVDKDANWSQGKTSYGAAKSAANEERYKTWLQSQGLKDNEQSRNKFDLLVQSEQSGRVIMASGKAFGKPEVEDAITKAANAYGIPRDLMVKMALIESNMNPSASRGPNGAKGLYQFVPDTAAAYGIKGRELDPYANAEAAARLFRDNMKQMTNKGIPITPTTMYLAHQQGAGGLGAIWYSAKSGMGISSKEIAGNMANNDPLGESKYRDPKLFLAAWEKKLGEGNQLASMFGVSPDVVAGVKLNSNIAAMSGGSPASTAMAAVASAPAPKVAPAATAMTALAAAPSVAPQTKASPAATANTVSDKVMTAATTPTVSAAPSTAKGNVMGGIAVATAAGLAGTAARESVQDRQLNTSSIQAAMAPTGGVDPALAELRQQTTLLAAIAGNTKELGGMSNSIVSAVNNVTNNNGAATKVAENVERSNTFVNNARKTDIFGNLTNRGDAGVLRPSVDALRIASGGNIPNMSPITV
jgi:hypothetical protein